MKNTNAIDSELNKDILDVESTLGTRNFVNSKDKKNLSLDEPDQLSQFGFSTNGIFIGDQQGKIISWNDEMEILTGVKHADAMNQYVWDMVYNLTPKANQNPALLGTLKKRFLTTINDWTYWKKRDYEHKMVTAAGSVIPVELSTFVSVSPNGNLLVVVVNETGPQKMPEKYIDNEFVALSKFNKFAVDLSRLNSDENIEAFISTRLKDFVGALGVVYSEYTDESHTLTPKHIEFDPGLLEKLVPLFDQHVHKIHSVLHDYMYHELVNNTVRINGSLFELSFGAIPYSVSNSVQSLLEAERFLRVSFHLNEKLYGTALLALRKNHPEPPAEIFDDLVSLASSAVKKWHTEETLRKNEEILRTISENTPDTIWYLDEDGRILYSNREISGYGKREIIGRTFCEWTLPEYHTMMFESLNTVITTGSPVTYESRALGFDQEIRWYSSRLTPVTGGEKIKNVVLSISDITEYKNKEQALLVSEENYRVISQSTFDAIFIIDRYGKQLFFNKSIESVLGYKIEDMVGRLFSDFLSGDQVEKYLKQLTNTFLYKEAGKFETVMFHNDGHLVDVEINIKPVKLKGEFVAQGSIRDISSKKQTERQLNESISRNQALLKSIPHIILIFDSNAKITEFYSINNDILKIDSETCVGKTAASLFPGEMAVQIQEKIGRVISSGEQCYQTLELKEGKALKYLESRYVPYGKNEVLLLISDITNQKQSEEALRISSESYLNIFNSVPEPIYLLDESGIILDVNRSAENIYKLSKEELIGKTIDAFSSADKNNFDEIGKLFKHVAETGEQVQFDFWRKGKDSQELFEEIIVNKGKYFGKTILIAVARDITDKQLAEEKLKFKNQELLTINAEKDKFFSIIAHDLRSPFNSFLGLTQLMAEDLPNMSFAEIQNIVVSMGKSADNLYGLLENLLEWSRFQRGMISFNPQEFVLEEKAKEIIRSLIDSSNKKGIELNFDIPDKLSVHADEYMFGSILRNLTSNAIKFTSKGGKISLSAKQIDGNSIEVAVADTGIGMDENMLHKLFNLNEYTNRQGTEGELSTGLGLILCKEFVEKHNGRIWVESEAGKGSTFHITIPDGHQK